MVVIKWHVKWKDIFHKFWEHIIWNVSEVSLTVRSLTYNAHLNKNYVIDVLLEPILWFVDNFARHLGRVSYLGRVFVFCVVVLTSIVVFIAYWVGLPYWWEINPYITVFLVIFGNWILLNIVFHYYMGVVTKPGSPPHGSQIIEAASICNKCISPRPPRTHHCSVCDRCILCMDHHCPWLNNCVGYFNARYFYLYMVYMVAGVCFLMIFGIDIGYQVLWVDDSGGVVEDTIPDPDLIGHPVRINESGAMVPVKDVDEYDDLFNFARQHVLPIPELTEAQRICAHAWKKKAVGFAACMCIIVIIALGFLSVLHGRQISRGETSVESHINRRLRKKGPYKNPYDFGRKKNWRLFLGLVQGRTFVRHVLLPSAHAPVGNGLSWHALHKALEDWP